MMGTLHAMLGLVLFGVATKGQDERDTKFEKDLLTGLISLILLAICAESKEPLYGYQIARRMEGGDVGGPKLKQGTIYPVLRSMEKQGLLRSQIKASEAGPPRKYYTITDKGRKKLKVWLKTWYNTRKFVDGIVVEALDD